MYTLQILDSFKKHEILLIKKDRTLEKRINKTLTFLQEDPLYPSLKSHKVNTPDYGLGWSSRVTGDIRIIWDYDSSERLLIILLDIGGHSGSQKVYK